MDDGDTGPDLIRFGVIAAGQGSRLSADGLALPKALAPVGGKSMVLRLLDIFKECGAREAMVAISEEDAQTREALLEHDANRLPVSIIRRTTPSPVHTLRLLSPYLRLGPSVVTTVDSVFSREGLEACLSELRALPDGVDCVMGVTQYVDDESPLWVGTDEDMMITGFYDSHRSDTKYVSAGVYCLNQRAFEILDDCLKNGQTRMRAFQRALVSEGLMLKAVDMGTVIDVDHMADVENADRIFGE